MALWSLEYVPRIPGKIDFGNELFEIGSVLGLLGNDHRVIFLTLALIVQFPRLRPRNWFGCLVLLFLRILLLLQRITTIT